MWKKCVFLGSILIRSYQCWCTFVCENISVFIIHSSTSLCMWTKTNPSLNFLDIYFFGGGGGGFLCKHSDRYGFAWQLPSEWHWPLDSRSHDQLVRNILTDIIILKATQLHTPPIWSYVIQIVFNSLMKYILEWDKWNFLKLMGKQLHFLFFIETVMMRCIKPGKGAVSVLKLSSVKMYEGQF